MWVFWGWMDGTPRVVVCGGCDGGGGAREESTSESLEWNAIFVDAYKCVEILYRCALYLEYSSPCVFNR
jgi:hypothetical protein